MKFCDDSWLIQGINMTAKIDAYPDLNRDLRFFPLGTENPKKLTNHQIQHYNEKGFIAPIDIFGRLESSNPEDLWRWMDLQRGQGRRPEPDPLSSTRPRASGYPGQQREPGLDLDQRGEESGRRRP